MGRSPRLAQRAPASLTADVAKSYPTGKVRPVSADSAPLIGSAYAVFALFLEVAVDAYSLINIGSNNT